MNHNPASSRSSLLVAWRACLIPLTIFLKPEMAFVMAMEKSLMELSKMVQLLISSSIDNSFSWTICYDLIGLWEVYNDYLMGNCAELLADEMKLSREEQVFSLALRLIFPLSFSDKWNPNVQSSSRITTPLLPMKGHRMPRKTVHLIRRSFQLKFLAQGELSPLWCRLMKKLQRHLFLFLFLFLFLLLDV